MEPDTKSVHGEALLNVVLERLWSYLETYLNTKEIKDQVLKATKDWIALEEIKLCEPMVFHEAEVLRKPWFLSPQNESIVFDFDAELKKAKVTVSDTKVGIPFGIEVGFKCNIRVGLTHLTSDFLPFFESCSLYFTEDPKLDFNFTDAGNLLDIPGLKGKLESVTKDIVNSLLVYPNRLAFPMSKQVQMAAYQFPPPVGVLRVQVVKIEKLSDSHETFGTPDFFYKVECYYGDFTSQVVESHGGKGDTKWSQTVDVLVTEPDLESLKIKFYEHDLVSDDFAGEVEFADLSKLIFVPKVTKEPKDEKEDKEAVVEKSNTVFPMKGDKTGEATICFEYMPFTLSKMDTKNYTPIKTIQPVQNQYFMICYVIKVETESEETDVEVSDKMAPKESKEESKEMEPMDVYFGCLNDISQIKYPKKAYTIDKNGQYQVPMVAKALMKSLPDSLDFVICTDWKDWEKTKVVQFALKTEDLRLNSFDYPQIIELPVEGMGNVFLQMSVASVETDKVEKEMRTGTN